MFAIVGRTFALLLQRWQLYVLCSVVATVVQTAIVFAMHRPSISELFASNLVVPALVTVVYAFVNADQLESEEPPRNIWSRILERVWAVIIIDLLLTYIEFQTIQLAAGTYTGGVPNFGGFLVATLLDFVSAAIIFADVIATVGAEGNPLWLLQHSIGRSAWIVVHGRGNLLRAILLVVLGFAIQFLSDGIAGSLSVVHIAHAQFIGVIPFLTFASVPLAALTVVVYRACVTASNAATPKP